MPKLRTMHKNGSLFMRAVYPVYYCICLGIFITKTPIDSGSPRLQPAVFHGCFIEAFKFLNSRITFRSAGMQLSIGHVHYWVWLTRRQQLASCEFCAVEKIKRRHLYHAAAAWGREK